ncbi:MAG TPA: alkaline phosphatase D family protein [Candidatus Limnocylindria bacterium]|jgi:alkaline phosphatase D|nr:alkaline phosphatase D family protein [Candidatus Limnocylindria bacterium]
MDRRAFLVASARIAALAALGPLGSCAQPSGPVKFDRDPFALGVASGDPVPDGVVLWTRLAPDPLHGGGVPKQSVDVEWLVARDEGMKEVVRTGTASAIPELAHSVHVDVNGLDPNRVYWYRFRAGGVESPIGRTQTAPPAGAVLNLRFAFASCQNYAHGYYTAHAGIAREDLQVVLFLGDYIYEGTARGDIVREYAKRGWSFSLADYRDRYAQYRTDKDLQASHAAFPWIVTWDDHEVENNYAGGIDKEDPRNKQAIAERAAGYQAFYEHMPVRVPRPQGPDMKLYRALSFGDLATFYVLDTRQYRSPEVALCLEQDETPSGYCPASIDPKRTMLGAEQRNWLLAGLAGSTAAWNFVAQSVRFAQQDSSPDPGRHIFDGVDNWMGYVADRQAILEQFARTKNPVVLSGDSHVNFVYDLRRDFSDPVSPPVGTELLGTSISSEGDPFIEQTQFTPSAKNPQLKFFDNHRGYVRCTLERGRLTADFRAVSTVRVPTATVTTTATFVINDGRRGADRA